ncbi:MAG: cupin domain-containing protein [Treponema sp.]|nr:cupin domain-containing protein [Treponema sp.]
MQYERFGEGPYPTVPLGDGSYSRRLLAFGGNLLLATMEFEAGSESAVHSHDEEQLTWCLSGEFTTEVGGVPGHLGPGDFFHAGKGVPHGARCVVAGALIHAFTPQREEYKKG